MSITDLLATLGPGVTIVYLAEEAPSAWHCELTLPGDRFTVTLVTASGSNPDLALANTVLRAQDFGRSAERAA